MKEQIFLLERSVTGNQKQVIKLLFFPSQGNVYGFFHVLVEPEWRAVAYPLRGLMRCVFRDALLHTTVVMCGYLHYCHLPVSFDQSGPSPLTSLINNTFLPAELLLTGCFLFFAPFLSKL